MTTTHINEVSPPTVTRPAPWKAWVSRIGLAALVLFCLWMAWPMAKGVWYGIAPPAPVPADQLPAWRESYSVALAEAKATGLPVLIDFTASWCPPCRVMEHDVWPDPRVREAIAGRVIPVQVDIDDPQSAVATRQHEVSGIPTILIVDGAGNELTRGGFMSAGDLVAFIEERATMPID